LSHEYQVVFLEFADFASHQFDVRVGKVVDAAVGSAGSARSAGSNGTTIVVNGNSKNAGRVQTLFSRPFTAGWQNFALKVDHWILIRSE
jgi:hypothetical protein